MAESKTSIKNFLVFLPSIFRYALVAYLFICVLFIVLFPIFLGKQYCPTFSQYNFVYLILAFILLILFIVIYRKLKNKFSLAFNKKYVFVTVLIVGSALILCWQILLITCIEYIPIGDTLAVTFNKFTDFSYLDFADSENSNVDEYLHHYPNLWFLAGLFYRYFVLMSTLGLNSKFLFLILQILVCILVDFSIIFITLIARKIINSQWAIITFLLSILLVGFSPNNVVVYSDTIGLFLTCFLLFCYVCIEKKWLKWSLIIFFSVISYSIKPTILAVGWSILFIEVISLIQQFSMNGIRKNICKVNKALISSIACSAASMVLALVVVNIIPNFGLTHEPEKEFDVTHYLMLGLNSTSLGMYDEKDYEFSASFSDSEQRKEESWNVIKERLDAYGPTGIIKLYAYKTVTNFGYGNFMHVPYRDYFQKNDNPNDLIKFIYNLDASKDNTTDSLCVYNICEQVLWFFLLICAIYGLYVCKKNKTLNVAIISIFVLAMFLMIFESNPRYLYLYSLFFVLLAVDGLSIICQCSLARRILKG